MVRGRAFGVRTAQLRQLWNFRSTASDFSCIGQCSNPRLWCSVLAKQTVSAAPPGLGTRVSGIVKHEAARVMEILRGTNAKEIKELHEELFEELHEWLTRMDVRM